MPILAKEKKTLNLSQLHKIFQRDGEDGLRAAFSQKDFEGKAKVSSTKQILDLLFPKRVDYFSTHEKHVEK
mgnify:CR=1 FL=1